MQKPNVDTAAISVITKKVLPKIKPTQAERQAMERFVTKLQKVAENVAKPYNVKPMLCGSVAKGTWLAAKNELDMFLLFNPAVPRAQLESRGMALAKEVMENIGGKGRIAYAEHPYLTGTVVDSNTTFKLDLVPCYDIADPSKIQSAVDRTPHHVRYVKANLKMPDEVRLLKAFAMACGCYGADAKTQGFSGYLCELLVLNYGMFADVISSAADWKAGIIIDLRGKPAPDAYKKFHAPLVLIDPVDPNRNVAAAVSPEVFYRFVRTCKDFLLKPLPQFFEIIEPQPYSISEIAKQIRSRGTRWYLITFKRPAIVDDILWPQMRRCLDILQTKLHEADFEVLRKGAWADDKQCALVLEMKEWHLPRIDKNIGPNIYSRHASDFLKHYKEYRVFIEGESWVVEVPHKHTAALFFLKDMLGRPEKELLKSGIPTKLASEMANSTIGSGGYALKMMQNLPDSFRSWLRGWFETDLNVC
ncbi:MAG: CCA tRNA nucleotidyltransferase [Candidatus Aenigmatarchaeota archaeon]|nr:CCA tRNA nucleotidyltransferase [Candidatus Aenigmarchaeota archaeon]